MAVWKDEKRDRWIAKYRDAAGKQHWESFRTQKEAKACEQKQCTAVREGKFVATNTRRTVADAKKVWWELCVEGTDNRTGKALRPTTQSLYGGTWRVHLEEKWGKRPLISIGTEEIATWKEDMVKASEGPKTVLNAVQQLGSILRLARRFKWIGSNPAEDVRKPKYKAKVKAFTREEFDRMLEACGADVDLRMQILFGGGCGLRIGEIFGLRWCDIDLERGVLMPKEQFTHGAKSDLKTENSLRAIPVPAEVVAELKAQKEKLDGNVVRIHQGPDERLIFTSEDGSAVDYSNWRNRSWLPMLKRTGPTEEFPKRTPVKGTFHMLRHTFCTLALSMGVQPKVVSTLAGHASVAFTMDQYADALPKDMDDAAEKVANALLRPVVANR